jgi:hypothetical protein
MALMQSSQNWPTNLWWFNRLWNCKSELNQNMWSAS